MKTGPTPFAAAVDWGTSSFRLWLVDRDGKVLGEARSEEGMMKAMETGFSAVLERHLADLGAPADLPAIVCGMAGARQGWREAAYLDTPAALEGTGGHAVMVEDGARDVRILPGIAQRDPQWPDVMRGEETQLLGVVAQGVRSGLVCMPGTHCKWVVLEDGQVARYATFMTGETYAVIASHSILRLAIGEEQRVAADDPVFAGAVREAFGKPQEAMARLFAIRAGPLLGLRDAAESAARLSGCLIGLELAGAKARLGQHEEVVLVASGRLGALYGAALEETGARVRAVDADEAVRAGLYSAALAIWGDDA